MLESERPLRRGIIRHWEVLGLIGAGALAAWQVAPALAVGLLAVGAGALIPWRASGRRIVPLTMAVTCILGGTLAATTAWTVRQIETNWGSDTSGVRGQVIKRASRRLEADLAAAVATARTLADLAIAQPDRDRLDGSRVLLEAAERPGLERGVVLFSAGEPWIWAGRHRIKAIADGPELSARITAFYVVLEARRQRGDRTAVAQVTLAADSAVPQRTGVLADRFAAATGVALQFFPPGRGPRNTDVFDYCMPGCRDTTVAPDTLFGVRMDPPGQGTHKLTVEAAGRRQVALAALVGLLLLLAGGRSLTRGLAATGLLGWLVFAPSGERLWPGGAFSSATYFADILGSFSASAGALAVTGAYVVVGSVVLFGRPGRARAVLAVPAAFFTVLIPWLLPALSHGLTPPLAGPGIGLWLEWQLALTLAGAGLLLLAGRFLAYGHPHAPRWMTVVALLWTVVLVAFSLLTWVPGGRSVWLAVAWLPAFILAIQPAGQVRLTTTVALVAGAFAAVLTWGAVADSRLEMAGRDVAGLRRGGDPIAIGLLERLGDRMAAEPPAGTAAGLYARWLGSPLAVDGYPARLAVWRDGAPAAQLALADLTVPPDSELAAVTRARTDRRQGVTAVPGVPATRYILAVPWPDGTVATVTLGPRSRVVTPRRIARFLRGDPVRTAPYTLTLSDPLHASANPVPPVSGIVWRRDGDAVRGEELLDFPDGTRHIHAAVPLGDMPGLPVRGMLILLLDVAVVGLLVLVAERLAGRARLPDSVLDFAAGGSFRARLAGALVVFFVVPTVAFATWSARRLDAEAERSRDLIIRQTLQDATGTAREFVDLPQVLARDLLHDLGERLGADLMLFDAGRLLQTTPSVLADLGVVNPYLPTQVFLRMVGDDDLEVALDEQIAGRATRVGYRALGGPIGLAGVLAAPRLAEDADLVRSEQDLTFGLILITLAGLAAALGFATVASRALARPVRSLREAALQVGRGGLPDPLGDLPLEFRPVADAFARMAQDVERGREALEAQRARTAAVLRSVATGVVALDGNLRVITANQRADALLERPVTLGDPLGSLGGEAWTPVWRWLATQAVAGDVPEPAEFTVGDREIRVQLAPLTGAAAGWVVAFDDTTERTRAVRVLAWGELARQIAHEIKNPLTPIRLGIQHLQRAWHAPRGEFEETLERTSRQILAEIERLDAVARAFSRFGAPPEAIGALETIDVAQVAREVAGLYALGQTPTVSVGPETPVMALARRDELKEVLVNLIDNARNAGAQQVRIVVESVAEHVRVMVRDNGGGIAPEDLPRIFEPRFSTTTSGAGLGLAIARRLVESWGGTLSAVSTTGRDTTLTLELLG